MLDPNDIKQIKQVIDESIDRKLPDAFDKAFDRKFPVAFDKAFEEKFPVAIDVALERFAATTLNKSFQGVQDQINSVQDQINKVVTKDEFGLEIDRLDAKLDRYPDKAYLDDKLADAVSEIGLRILKRDEKEKNFKLYLIDVLKTHLHVPDDVALKLRELAEVK